MSRITPGTIISGRKVNSRQLASLLLFCCYFKSGLFGFNFYHLFVQCYYQLSYMANRHVDKSYPLHENLTPESRLQRKLITGVINVIKRQWSKRCEWSLPTHDLYHVIIKTRWFNSRVLHTLYLFRSVIINP